MNESKDFTNIDIWSFYFVMCFFHFRLQDIGVPLYFTLIFAVGLWSVPVFRWVQSDAKAIGVGEDEARVHAALSSATFGVWVLVYFLRCREKVASFKAVAIAISMAFVVAAAASLVFWLLNGLI